MKGVNVEASLSPVPQLSFQTGWTLQSSLYEEPQEWQDSENIGKEVVSYESRHILRTPDFYGSFSATYTPWESSSVSLSGVYTGSMKVPHLKGGYSNGQEITTNKLVSSKEFFDLGVKFTHDWDIKETLCIQLNFGVQNILNSYQSDFDAGVSRDSGYIYGPMRPRTYFLGLKFSNLF